MQVLNAISAHASFLLLYVITFEADHVSSIPLSAHVAEMQPRVQLYEAGERVKLNDVVEVYGVLSRVPELAAARLDAGAANGGPHGGDALLEEDAEELAAWQSTSLVRIVFFYTAP